MYVKQLLEEQATVKTYAFNYGGDSWQNLLDAASDQDIPFVDRKKLVLLLWQDEEYELNEYGAKVGSNWDAEFNFVVRGKLSDADYNYKYENSIKHLKDVAKDFFEQLGDCTGFVITYWKEIEVENVYDTNFDGLKIKMKLKQVT